MMKRLWIIMSLLGLVLATGWQLVQAEPTAVAKQQKTVTDMLVLAGNIEVITPASITLEGEEILLNDATLIEGELEVDAFAIVEAIEENGSLTAVIIFVIDDGFEDYISLVGEVTAVDDTSITIDGEFFLIDDETLIEGELTVGEFVYLEAVETDNGGYTATYIEVLEDDGGIGDTIEWVGIVEALSDDSLVVSGLTFAISDTTVISGELALGVFVYVEGEVDNATPTGGEFTATYIEALDDSGNNFPVEWFGFVESFSDTEIVVDGWTFAITPNTQIDGVLAVGEFVFVLGVDNGDGTFTAEFIEVLEDDGGVGDLFEWLGMVEELTDTSVVVDGLIFALTDETEIEGELAVGEFVFVLAQEDNSGNLTALVIEVLEDDGIDGISYVGLVTDYAEDDYIVLDDMTFLISDTTEISGVITIGSPVYVYAEENDSGDYVALYIEALTGNGGGGEIFWAGPIEEVGDSDVTVAGMTFVFNENTIIEGELAVGEFALVTAIEEEGVFVAQMIIVLDDDFPNEISLVGEVSEYTGDSITIDGQTFVVTEETEIVGEITIGGEVYLVAEETPAGVLVAVYIEVLEQEPDVITHAGLVTAVTTDTVVVDDWAFLITEETEIEGELAVDAFVFVVAQETDTGDFVAFYIEVLEDNGWPDIIDLVGQVTEINEDGFMLDGELFLFVNDETEIEGDLEEGVDVYVSAEYDPTTDTYTALYVEVLGDDGNEPEPVVLLGLVEAYTDTQIIVDGMTILINNETQIMGGLAVGEFVFVVAFPSDEGDLMAQYIEILNDDGGPATQGAVIGEVTELSDDEITVVDINMNLVSDTVVVGDIEVGTLVYAEYQVQPDGSRVALLVESLEEAATTGQVESMSVNALVVDGQTFQLDGRAQVEGRITVGTEVYVGATADQGGNRTARLIRALDQTGGYTVYLPVITKN